MESEDEVDTNSIHDLNNSDEEQNDFLENPDVQEGDEPGEPTEADGNDNEGEDQTGTTEKKPVKKRVVLNPRPKLDASRLSGKRGLPILPKLFQSRKFKGKGFEKEDLNRMMCMLEHWGHRLFPLMTFDTLLTSIEKLGTKKPVQVCIRKMRMDMPLLDDDFITQRDDDDEEPSLENKESENQDHQDPFEQLLRSQNATNFNDSNMTNTFSNTSLSHMPSQSVNITDEMRERMEKNKRLAMEKRRLRQLQEEGTKQQQQTETTCGDVNVDESVGDSNMPTDIELDAVMDHETDKSFSESMDIPEKHVAPSNSQTEFKPSSQEVKENHPKSVSLCQTNFGDCDSSASHNKQKETAELLDEDELLNEMWRNSI